MVEVEQELHALAVVRDDILSDDGIHDDAVLITAGHVRPQAVMNMLNVSGRELVELVKAGIIPRPGKWGGTRVAWRRDEIAGTSERVRDWLDDKMTR